MFGINDEIISLEWYLEIERVKLSEGNEKERMVRLLNC